MTLSEWTVEGIVKVLGSGCFETETYDLKERLPDTRDGAGKNRLRTTCAAFANSYGGFLVVGIADDRSLDPERRLIGLDPKLDFPERFGNYPQSCVPSVQWTFKNPPLRLQDGKLLHVVHVPRSWRAPHAVGDAHRGWRFPKRTNKGNEGMSIEEVRMMFLGYYEKRLKLQLLRSELDRLREAAVAMLKACNPDYPQYSLVTFDTNIIESVISDAYTILASQPLLLGILSKIRSATANANTAVRILHSKMALPLSNMQETLQQHNKFIGPVCSTIHTATLKAMAELDKALQGESYLSHAPLPLFSGEGETS